MIRSILVAVAACLALPLHAESLVVRGNRLFIPVEVRGEQIEALLDSGAELTIFDRHLAQQLHFEDGKTVEARGTGAKTTTAELIRNIQVKALGRELSLPAVAVMDLSDVGSRLVGTPLPLILGREIFDAGRLAIDVNAGTIDWLSGDDPARGFRLPLTLAHGIETFPVRFGDIDVNADFDLGNGSDLLVSTDLAAQLNLQPVGIEPAGGIGGAAERPVVYVSEVTVAGRTFTHVRAHVTENLQVPSNIGVSVLRHFRIVTDFPNREIWLAPAD